MSLHPRCPGSQLRRLQSWRRLDDEAVWRHLSSCLAVGADSAKPSVVSAGACVRLPRVAPPPRLVWNLSQLGGRLTREQGLFRISLQKLQSTCHALWVEGVLKLCPVRFKVRGLDLLSQWEEWQGRAVRTMYGRRGTVMACL